MKNTVSILVSIILFANSYAFGKAKPTQTNLSYALILEKSMPLIKKFKNLKEFFLYMDTISPNKGYGKYAKFVEKNSLINGSLSKLKVSSNKVYWPGVKEPVYVLNDNKSLQYKGIKAKFYPGLGPEKNHQIAFKAWGHFSEFKIKKSTKKLFHFLFLNEVQAQTKEESFQLSAAGSAISILGLTIAIAEALLVGAVVMGAAVAAMVYGGAALALYAVSRWLWLNLDDKANELANSKLECKLGEGQLTTGEYAIKHSDFPDLTFDERLQAKEALNEICKDPKAVEKFNDAFTLTKKKIYSGDVTYFTKESPSINSNKADFEKIESTR